MKLTDVANKVILKEGVWGLPDNSEKVMRLAKLFEVPLPAQLAPSKLHDIFGNDDFFDELERAKKRSPVEDVRPLMKRELKWTIEHISSWRKKPSQEVVDDLELLLHMVSKIK